VIRFTRHARNRMRLYRIAAEEVRYCVEQPDETHQQELASGTTSRGVMAASFLLRP
jgi:hypothetical protein